MLLKKLSILLLRSYAGPFVITFLVAMFIFEMQFIWVYLDDLMGKGLEAGIIFRLLLYASARIVNMALPLAILMSSIMTFGALAENNELTSMKGAGVSLFRIMRPLIVFTIVLSSLSFFFANNIWPIANLKFRTLLYSIVQQRPALNLENGVFYNGIEGISIRVMDRNPETNELSDVLIYDHREQSRGNRTVIRSRKGTMKQTEDKRFLILTLYDGQSYDEQEEKKRRGEKFPLIKGSFEQMILRLDLSSFAFSGNNEDIFKNSHEMMTVPQLSHAIDSLEIRRDSLLMRMSHSGIEPLHLSVNGARESVVKGEWFFDLLTRDQKDDALQAARETTRRAKDLVIRNLDELEGRDKYIRRHRIEWHRKFILGVACLVLFFIGAPLGAIIRKGGMGLPTVIALGLFILYQLMTIAGEKMAKSGLMPEWLGMWLSTAIMMPLSIWLTYKASREATLFDRDTYSRILSRFNIFRLFKRPIS